MEHPGLPSILGWTSIQLDLSQEREILNEQEGKDPWHRLFIFMEGNATVVVGAEEDEVHPTYLFTYQKYNLPANTRRRCERDPAGMVSW